MTRIAILGAGITGVTSAYALAQLGYQVTVYDRQRYPAMETSYANGGQLSASNAEVWNSTATLVKGLKWMFRRDAPLLLNPAFSLHKYGWLARFMRHIPDHERNTIATTRLAIEARAHLFEMARTEGIEFDLERRGILHIYHDQASFEAARRGNTLMQRGGLERHAVSSAEARAIEPALRTSCHGAFYTPSDSTGDIHKFTRGLALACARRGVLLRQDCTVLGIKDEGGAHIVQWRDADGHVDQARHDAVVICAGAASQALAATLGDQVPVYPVKGYSITVHLDQPGDGEAAPRVSLLDEAAKIVTSRLGARLRVAGTAEFNGYNKDIRADRIEPLVQWTRRHFPGIATQRVEPWSGLRPMTPNMMPVVRRGSRPGVYYNTGHGHLGWTLSAATAPLLASLVAAAQPPD